MTLAEIVTVLDQEKRGPLGAVKTDLAQAEAEMRRWQDMTPLERLKGFER